MGEWKLSRYVCDGIHHKDQNKKGQDNIDLYKSDDFIVAALSDGLGSLEFSGIASKAVTEAVCEFFKTEEVDENLFYSDGFKKRFLDYLKSQAHIQADEAGVPYEEMDCTLAFTYISLRDSYAVVGRIGDSAVSVIYVDSKNPTVYTESNKSANGTSTVLYKDATDRFDLRVFKDDYENLGAFILCSDGLDSEIYMKGLSVLRKSAEKYINAVSENDDETTASKKIEEYITKLVDQNPSFNDDISLIVVSRLETSISLPQEPTWLCKCGNRNAINETYCSKCNSDFVNLYMGIRFKEYGGKASFFQQINNDPVREREIIGLSPLVDLGIDDEIRAVNSGNDGLAGEESNEREITSKDRINKAAENVTLADATNSDAIKLDHDETGDRKTSDTVDNDHDSTNVESDKVVFGDTGYKDVENDDESRDNIETEIVDKDDAEAGYEGESDAQDCDEAAMGNEINTEFSCNDNNLGPGNKVEIDKDKISRYMFKLERRREELDRYYHILKRKPFILNAKERRKVEKQIQEIDFIIKAIRRMFNM